MHRYRPMVRGLAYQYQLPAQQREDLIQVGYLGLIKAINNFDPSVWPELRPYAKLCVSGEIKRYFRDKRWMIRVSRRDQELLQAATAAQADLAGEVGGTPSDEEVARRLDVGVAELRHAYQAHHAFAPGSLDAPAGPSGSRDTGDLIGADDPGIEHAVDMAAVRQHWPELPPVQRQVLHLRFYASLSQSQVAEKLHCSQMHVSRLQARALAYLRERLTAEGAAA